MTMVNTSVQRGEDPLHIPGKLRLLGVTLGAFALGAAAPACADPITYQFSGHLYVTGISGTNASWQFQSGQSFRGTLVYDVDAISFAYKYIDTPEVQLVRYASPIVSMAFEIDLANGSYNFDVPVGNSIVNVVNDASSYPRYGVNMYMDNYNWDGTPRAPIPASAKVGSWNPHSTFLDLNSPDAVLASTDPDVDLVKLFNVTPEFYRVFSVRFSDPSNWTPGVEHIDGSVFGRIETFTVQSAVPEPRSWAMLILGFGAVGAGLRRRAGTDTVRQRA